MVISVIDINIIKSGFSMFDWLTIFSFIFSLISITISLFYFLVKIKSDKFNILITPKRKITGEDAVYIFFTLENKSSAPISFTDFKLSDYRDTIPSDDNGIEGGTVIYEKTKVNGILMTNSNSESYIDTELFTEVLPINLQPYEAKGIYLGFVAPGLSAKILNLRDVKLNVKTSRKDFELNLFFGADNFADFSFNGHSFEGPAVIKHTKIKKFKNFFKL